MDTSSIEYGGKGIEILDLWACVAFKSASSISFTLGRWSNEFTLPSGPVGRPDGGTDEGGFTTWYYDTDCVFKACGRLDVHHPCEEVEIKTQFLCRLPAEYHSDEKMRAIVSIVMQALRISVDETFWAEFMSAEQVVLCAHAPHILFTTN
jgi:hypothetical protein